MASDTEGAEVLSTPLYRSTFVLAYRNDKGIDIKSLDDTSSKSCGSAYSRSRRSARRSPITAWSNNTVVHYLSHNADVEARHQPSYQVQQVIDGTLDVAAVGSDGRYYKTITACAADHQAGQPDGRPGSDGIRHDARRAAGPPGHQVGDASALEQHKDEIQQILVDFGVPLVKCDDCLVSGDLPSHGPYAEPQAGHVQTAADPQKCSSRRMAELKKWLAQGANPDTSLRMRSSPTTSIG